MFSTLKEWQEWLRDQANVAKVKKWLNNPVTKAVLCGVRMEYRPPRVPPAVMMNLEKHTSLTMALYNETVGAFSVLDKIESLDKRIVGEVDVKTAQARVIERLRDDGFKDEEIAAALKDMYKSGELP